MKPYIVRDMALYDAATGIHIGDVRPKWMSRMWIGRCEHCGAVNTRETPTRSDEALWRNYLDEHKEQ